MRALLSTALLMCLVAPAGAISLEDAQTEADAWVVARWDTIKSRVQTCLNEEGGPWKCHTAWAASTANYCENNAGTGASLCSVTLDDPGQWESTACGDCYNGLQTFALAGISIPATAPLNAPVNIAKGPAGRGEQLIIRFQYDGELWEKAWGDAIIPGFAWRLVDTTP